MAKNRKYNFSAITKLSRMVNSRMNDLYRQTYSSNRGSRKELEDITDRAENNIDAIMNRNNDIDVPNITKLYTRMALNNTLKDKKTQRVIEDVFSDENITNNILSSYLENKNVKDLMDEIDVICKYMPKLDEALKAKRDAILSSDNFSKDYINASISSLYNEDRVIFSTRIESIKKKYNLRDKFDKFCYETMRYGEEFVYHAPYKKAMQKLLQNKNNTINISRPGGIHESVIDVPKNIYSTGIPNTSYKVNLFFNFSGVLESAVNECRNINESLSILSEIGSLNESTDYLSIQEDVNSLIGGVSLNNNKPLNVQGLKNFKGKSEHKFNKTIYDDLEYPSYEEDKTAKDGLIKTNISSDGNINLKVPGCVLKKLKQWNVLPLYIEDICLGYYYFEFDPNTDANSIYDNNYDNSGYGTAQLSNRYTKNNDDIKAQKAKTDLLRYLASNIAAEIDAKFINTNSDLAKEIYAILKFNDLYNTTSSTMNIKVTYIPEEDLTHIKFEEDPDTHRGISDIQGCLLAAKMYSCIKINDTLASLTRSQDRRVYYVKQNAETNIAQTLMNVINQIKRSNFNIRQVENMNSILNIIGRYNDFVIPVGPSGDAPVQMEVMSGQDIQPNTELLDKLEEECINSTGIPLELINARYSTDFATQITMSNIKFLRHCILRQEKLEYYYSRIMSVIYNAEYEDHIYIKCVLPQPLFLNITNLNSVIETVRTNVETIANYEYDNESNEANNVKKAMFMKYMMRQKLSTYVKEEEVENAKTLVDFEYSRRKTNPAETNNEVEY